MTSRTRESLLPLLFLMATCAVVHGQTDPYAETNARIRPLIMGGNEKARSKDYDGASADFTEAIELGKDLPSILRAGPYINRGLAYADKGDLDAGLADLNQAIKLQPNSFYAYQDRGDIYRKRKEPDKAIADFTKAIKLNSKFPSPYMTRGLTLLAEGKDTEANADFARYLDMFPAGKNALDKQIADIKAKRSTQP
jgi:tetratricopeptide (TPR) repeat protein